MNGPIWVFGYGSLLWNPGFEVAEQQIARLDDYQRSFCMRSIHHRGTQEKQGLVLALDEMKGAFCDGLALKVAAEHTEATIAYLRERELISSAYLEEWVDLDLTDGRRVKAVAYVIDPNHIQYCGGIDLEEQAQQIAFAVGQKGPNTEYLYATADHLNEIGLSDHDMNWLVTRVREIVAT
ncbi:MAG: gamma-glutamylcyclotransferase [Paracoccaceae bacterium]|nr:gamma-glutamylcyclotransferase [Paracoccaceae bacterium]